MPLQETYMVSTQICCASLNMEDSHQRPTIFSWVTMLTEGSRASRQYACFLRTR